LYTFNFLYLGTYWYSIWNLKSFILFVRTVVIGLDKSIIVCCVSWTISIRKFSRGFFAYLFIIHKNNCFISIMIILFKNPSTEFIVSIYIISKLSHKHKSLIYSCHIFFLLLSFYQFFFIRRYIFFRKKTRKKNKINNIVELCQGEMVCNMFCLLCTHFSILFFVFAVETYSLRCRKRLSVSNEEPIGA
jgi:hypothetical protein